MATSSNPSLNTGVPSCGAVHDNVTLPSSVAATNSDGGNIMFDCCDTTNVADTVSSSGETTVIVASRVCADVFSDSVSKVIVVFPATAF